VRLAAALALLLVVGCDDTSPPDGNDLSALSDGGGGVPDLFGADLTCTQPPFEGFGGFSPSERRLACPCGCTIDTFASPQVAGFWQPVTLGTTQLAPSAAGLTVTVTASGSETALAALSSLEPTNRFYLDGDFDLLIDYELLAAPPDASHVILNVRDPDQMAITSSYTVERERTAAGEDRHTAYLGGIPHVRVPTSAQSGTLELRRTGLTVQALASGTQVSQFTGAVAGRLAVFVNGTVEGCAADAGGCTLSVRWRNLRLAHGTLVDRK
jgi:hypothetical protein